MLRRRPLLTAAATLPMLGTARAQSFPSRPITVLVPFVAGGPSDIVARVVAARLGATLGQAAVAENRPGANGAIAGGLLARAQPDGHTLLVGSIGVFAINPALRTNLPYDPVRDFAPLSLCVTTPNVLVVNDKVPARDVPQLVAWLKANPGSYSTSGVGSSDHLTAELFKQATGTDVTHVPYGGGAAAATDLIAGNVQMSFQNLGTVAGHISGGRLRALAVTSAQRHPTIPGVPTMVEQGFQDFVVTSWQAAATRAGTPAPIIERLNTEIVAGLKTPETTARLEAIGFTVVASSPAEFEKFQADEIARWKRVIATANIKAE